MSEETLLTPADEDGFVIAWRSKYEFQTGRLEGATTYAEAFEKCERLRAENPDKTYWPQRAGGGADSYGKFHKAH